MLGKKGQGIAIDFLFAVLLFLMILNASMTIIDNSNKNSANKAIVNSLNDTLSQTLDRLVRSGGEPVDWEGKTLDETILIGLAKRDRVLDNEKVERFSQWAGNYSDLTGDYNKTKSRLLMGYDFYFVLTDSLGNTLKIPGTPGDAWDNMQATNLKRVVNYNGGEAIAELTLYYPR